MTNHASQPTLGTPSLQLQVDVRGQLAYMWVLVIQTLVLKLAQQAL